MDRPITRIRFLLGAAAIFALLTVPVALAASGGDTADPQATASGVKQKVKKLTKRVKALEQQLAAQGGSRPPSGPAGGDFTGTYPNPQLGANTVTSNEVVDESLTPDDLAPSALVRSAFAEDASLALVGTSGNAVTATIDAPTSGFLLMTAGSDVFNFTSQDFVTCRLRVDGAIVTGSPRQMQLDGNGVTNQEEDCSTEGALAVPAGTHTVDLEGAGLNANSVFDETTLQVLFVPLGANGAQP
jgi:hypothetical protein